MTDITDQDRRIAREWAASIDPEIKDWSDWALAASRVILATAKPPEPTISEEIMDLGRALDQHGHFDALGIDVAALADRADQMEHDLAEASAEVEALRDRGVALVHERDKARRERDAINKALSAASTRTSEALVERDEARDEVERLTAVNENLRKTDNYKEFREAFLTVQKGAESDKESPNPDDVKPGEAWIVEAHGERRTAVKDRDSEEPWLTVNADGRFFVEGNEIVTLISRLVPAPRVITDPDDLDDLPTNTTITAGNTAYQRADEMTTFTGEWWYRPCDNTGITSAEVLTHGPATVVQEPEA